MNSLSIHIDQLDRERIVAALKGMESMLMQTRESLTRRNGDASLSNYLVYSRAFKLMGAVELADAMGIDVTEFSWLWKLKPAADGKV